MKPMSQSVKLFFLFANVAHSHKHFENIPVIRINFVPDGNKHILSQFRGIHDIMLMHTSVCQIVIILYLTRFTSVNVILLVKVFAIRFKVSLSSMLLIKEFLEKYIIKIFRQNILKNTKKMGGWGQYSSL